MKNKQVIALLMSVLMGAGVLTGCGSASMASTGAGGSYFSSDEEGKVINIWTWNEEFRNRVTDYYPEVKETSSDGTVTTLKDGTEIHWTINPNQDGVYQDKLDEALKQQASADQDDKIDIFLAETDYLVKYIDKDIDVAIPLKELGIDPESDLYDQYKYTKDAACDADGVQRATSWQGCPGVFIYRRDIAREVFGTDDPDEVHALIADWDKYNEAAEKLKEAGYYMNSSTIDTQRVYTNNTKAPWVEKGSTTVKVDENVVKWIKDTKENLDKGYIHTTDGQWADTWNKDQGADSKVFGFFGPAWFVDFTLTPNYGESAEPNWGICESPQAYNWGGSFIVGCSGTDNKEHIKDIMLSLTGNKDVLLDIAKGTGDFTNTQSGMKELSEDDSFKSEFLCGQNPYKIYAPAAENIVMDKLSPYDQGCVEALGNSFGDYFNDKVDFEKAKENFETTIKERYPDITEVVWPE
ncbi:MAG: ABC transporter substrate-binding protein [Lachnospiraceae bacterium]|nr:ABC transporter substrate-binding protein [Lachnospiraceae bacterium]